jgi:hypothetical protein
MIQKMATQCLAVTNPASQGSGKGRRTRSSRVSSTESEPFTNIASKQSCPGTPSAEAFGTKLATSTPASSASLSENTSRNQPKPQVTKIL